MSMAYIRSAENRKVLVAYAQKHLVQQWPKQAKAVHNAIELALEDAIEDSAAPYVSWSNTKENASYINVCVFKALKVRVESIMRGAQVDHEEELTEMFRGPAQRDSVRFEEVSEGLVSDRSHEALRERHAQAWM